MIFFDMASLSLWMKEAKLFQPPCTVKQDLPGVHVVAE